MSSLEDLYRKRILEEAKSPFHFEKSVVAEIQHRAYNPVCGDRYDLAYSQGSWYFHGFGCTISKASTSMLLQALEGKTKQEQKVIVNEAIRAFQGENVDLPKELETFSDSKSFETRKDCVLLSWLALKQVFNQEGS